MDHVEDDEDQEKPRRPAGRRAALMGELRYEQSNRPEHGADESEVESEQQGIDQREIRLENHAADIGEDPDQHRHREQGGPRRRQLLNRHAHTSLRRREQHVERDTVLLPAQHPAAGKDWPDRHQEDEDSDLEGRVASDRVGLDRVGVPGERGGQAEQRRPCLGRLHQLRHAGHRRDDDQAHADSPSEDGDPVVAQRLQEDALKPHPRPPSRNARRLRRSEGMCPRDSAPRWLGTRPGTEPRP